MYRTVSNFIQRKLFRWILAILTSSILIGAVSAAFLISLNYVTALREQHLWIIAALPLAGILIVYLYRNHTKSAGKGNNLLLEAYYNPKGQIPFIMAPLILLTTLLTHLFGGSAGREGTAVQYGGVIADFVGKKMKFDRIEMRIILICGISAGFASLFGTPLAGAIFSLEVLRVGKMRLKALLPTLLVAYLAHYTCVYLGAPHTHYPVITYTLGFNTDWLWAIALGAVCGLAVHLFVGFEFIFTTCFRRITNPYYRVASGAVLIILIVALIGNTKHIGLGLSTLVDSFHHVQSSYDFLFKIILTTLTLTIGFKGGEVTPLFFVGATLASAVAGYTTAPYMLVVAIGFVAVFAGATKTPLASAIMAAELFGFSILPVVLLGTLIAVWISGNKRIYKSQRNIKFL